MKKIIILLLIIAGFSASQVSAQVSGKLTFLYKGAVVDPGHFPNSTTVTDSFPGYINVSLIPANAVGIPLGGPAATLPSTGVGIAYASLNAATGEYTYSFSGVANGTYLVVPSFTNPLLTGSASRVSIGHYGAIGAANYGTPVVINNNTISNVNIYVDTRLAQASILGARNTTSATFAGSYTITAGFNLFPTGTPGVPGQVYLALVGYKLTTPTGGQPDLFVAITKPAVGNVAVFTKEALPFASYNRITLNAYSGTAPVYTTPFVSYAVGTNDTLVFSASNTTVFWNTDVSLARLSAPKSDEKQPTTFNLEQNYPNPFNPSTTIKYFLPTNASVSLRLYDLLGHEVKTLATGQQSAGEHTVTVDASALASGVYFYKLQAGTFTATKKMTLVR